MKQLLFCIFLLLLEGCSSNQPPAVSGQIDELPTIYPDYIDVTIPQSIAPLNFAVQTGRESMRGIYNRRICIYRLRLQRSLFHSQYRLGKVIDCGKRKTGRGICPDRRKREMECLSSVSYPGFRRPDRSVYRLPPDRSRLPAMERDGNLSTRIILFRSGTDSGKPPDG